MIRSIARKIALPLAATAVAGAAIAGGSVAVSSFAGPSPSVQQGTNVTSVAWLPPPRNCSVYTDQYGRRYTICR